MDASCVRVSGLNSVVVVRTPIPSRISGDMQQFGGRRDHYTSRYY